MKDKTENMNNATELCVDDGLEKIIITNRFGDELGVFYFRPTDTGIIDRYNKSLTMLEKAVEPLRSSGLVGQDNDDTEDAAATIVDTLNAVKGELFKAFDYLFDASVSEAFFARVNPFTISNGKFYCETVLDAIGSYMASRVGAEVKQINKRVARYTHGVKTGKHKDGKK